MSEKVGEVVRSGFRPIEIRPPGPAGRDLSKRWDWDADKRRLINKGLGVMVQCCDVVYQDDGTLQHEGMLVVGRRSELCITLRERDGHVGLVYHRREKVLRSGPLLEFYEKHPTEIPDPFALPSGIEEYELPHGLAGQKLAEANEEIQLKVLESYQVGVIHDVPPLTAVPHIFFAVKVGEEPSGKKPEPGEQIKRVDFFHPAHLRRLDTICGLTQAGFWAFRRWALARPVGDFYERIAAEM